MADLDLQAACLLAVAAVELVGKRLARSGRRSCGPARSRTNGDDRRFAGRGARERPRPLPHALGGDDADARGGRRRAGRRGTRRRPPITLPTLATSTQLALPSNHLSPSMRTRVRDARQRRCSSRRSRRTRARPRRSFSAPSASRIIKASRPAPAMTTNRSPLICPTSSRRR